VRDPRTLKTFDNFSVPITIGHRQRHGSCWNAFVHSAFTAVVVTASRLAPAARNMRTTIQHALITRFGWLMLNPLGGEVLRGSGGALSLFVAIKVDRLGVHQLSRISTEEEGGARPAETDQYLAVAVYGRG
jgi:hypothetical protein